MFKGCDMIVSLYNLPQKPIELKEGIKIKRVFAGDKETLAQFIGEHFARGWIYEAEHALMQDVSKCFIATENGKIIGFACYDATTKGYFGPIGVHPDHRGENIGQALLMRTLEAMREYGYGYGIIGWVSDAEMFYRKTVGAEFIPGGEPENTYYSNLVIM